MTGQADHGSGQGNKARPGSRRVAQWMRDYVPLPGIPDEYIAQDGTPRSVWTRFFEAFATLTPAEIERRFGPTRRVVLHGDSMGGGIATLLLER